MTDATQAQVQAVRIRLHLSPLFSTLRQRGIEAAELTQVVGILVDRHGLHADIEVIFDRLYWRWKQDPRLTLSEHVRQAKP